MNKRDLFFVIQLSVTIVMKDDARSGCENVPKMWDIVICLAR